MTHILFLHGLFPHYTDSIMGVEWYLGVLVLFYIISPLLYKIIKNLRSAIIAWMIGSILGFLFVRVALQLMPEVEDVYIYQSFVESFCFLSQISVLLLGIVLFYALKSNNVIESKKERLLMSYTMFVFGVVMIAGMANGYTNIYGVGYTGTFGICFFVIAYGQDIYSNRIVNNTILRSLGRHSYSIYLFHHFMIIMYDKYVQIGIGTQILDWLIKYVIVVVVTAFMAILLEKIYEKPLLNIIMKFINK